jgi:hypothetical protein
MTTLAGNEHKMFSLLCELYGFVPATAIANERFASLVKKLNDQCYAYVFVRDERPEGGEMLVSIWVAPPHTPNERLDRPDVGYKVVIAGGCALEDDFFRQCEHRITDMLPALGELADAVAHQLWRHNRRSQHRSAHQRDREAFASLKRLADSFYDAACVKSLRVARQLAEGDASWSTLKKACVLAAESLLEHGALPEDAVEFHQGDADSLGASLAGQAYVDALGTLSSSVTWEPPKKVRRKFKPEL